MTEDIRLAALLGAEGRTYVLGTDPEKHRLCGDLYRISPANPTRMRDPDANGQQKYWIIEVHLVDRDRTFGGFYERLLVPRAQ